MFNNPYMQQYSPQASIDRINAQMNELENMKSQLQQRQQQPTNLTQNFQLAPQNHDVIKYASSIDEVQRDMVIGDTPFFSKDMSVVWIKNTKGEIKTYELNEIVPLDDKDIQIQYLQSQIEELKGKINNEQPITNVDGAEDTTDTEADGVTAGKPAKTAKSTGVQRVSASKKKQ